MTTPSDVARTAMNLWWWTSFPYSLLFLALVQVFHPSPGYLAHVLFPFTILFWIVLLSSTAWTLVSLFTLAIRRSKPMTTMNKVMVLLGILTSFFGLQSLLG